MNRKNESKKIACKIKELLPNMLIVAVFFSLIILTGKLMINEKNEEKVTQVNFILKLFCMKISNFS